MTMQNVTKEQYAKLFAEPSSAGATGASTSPSSPASTKEADTRAGRALAFALDIRKFEIELYWKRATYFWAFIAAAFAGYGLTYKNSTDHEPWLSLLFASLGLVFSFTWYLVNRGSKFWQNNWERHVDLLEDLTLGPLYKIIAEDSGSKNFVTSSAPFSVSKLNQILSVFVTLVWALLFVKSLAPVSFGLSADGYKVAITILTVAALASLLLMGVSSNKKTTSTLKQRIIDTTPSPTGAP